MSNKLRKKNKTATKSRKIPQLSERAQLNYALITSEFQSFSEFLRSVGLLIGNSDNYKDRLNARYAELEDGAREELKYVFGMNVSRGELANTAIYNMDDKLRDYMEDCYHKAVLSPIVSREAAYVYRLAHLRKISPVHYTYVSPIHNVLAFVKSHNFAEQFEAYEKTKEEGYEVTDTDVLLSDIERMMNTLVEIALAPVSEFRALVLRIAVDDETPKPRMYKELADLLLADVIICND